MERDRRRKWTELDELLDSGLSRDSSNIRGEQVDDVESASVETASEEDNYRELLQRVKADFVNYKHRVERDREEYIKAANGKLIMKLLPAIDDLERALQSVSSDSADPDWVEGIALIHRKLMAVLGEEGLTKIDAEGKEFDPWEHEAVFCEDCSSSNDAVVKSVLRDGYRLYDRVIRPAQVVVTGRGDREEDELTMDLES